MRLRITIVTALAVGIFMSTSGAGVAFQGFHQSDNAGEAQYGPITTVPNQPERIGPLSTPGPGTSPTTQPGRVQVPRLVPALPPINTEAQAPRQVEAGGNLAVTGYAAIPVLLLGAALLVTGLALRRKAPGEG
jgi:hypothetical protein